MTVVADHLRDFIFQTQTWFVTSRHSVRAKPDLFHLEDFTALRSWLTEQLHNETVLSHAKRSSVEYLVVLPAEQRSRLREVYHADVDHCEKLQDHSHYS